MKAPAASGASCPLSIGIVGAGVTGLAAAHRLAGLGHRVAVFEASGRAGGLAAGFKEPGWSWYFDDYYHHWFTSDDAVLSLCREMGHGDKVFFSTPVTSIFLRGAPRPADTPFRILTLPAARLADRLRSGLVVGYLRFFTDWHRLERYTAAAWLTRAMGRPAYTALWEPLLRGKFGDDADRVTMAWFWARVRKRSRRLGYYRGGFQAFANDLVSAVTSRGGSVELARTVTRIEATPDGGFVVHAAGRAATFDRVLATVPPDVLMRIVPALPPEYAARVQGLKTLGALTLALALDRPLTNGHYWINLPKSDGFAFLVLVEHTKLVDASHYGGEQLVYCGDYLEPDHRYFGLGADRLLAEFTESIRRVNPAFDTSWVRRSWVLKTAHAQPVPFVNHSRAIPAMATPIPGLHWAWMSHVYPWDRGTNYAVTLGLEVAADVAAP